MGSLKSKLMFGLSVLAVIAVAKMAQRVVPVPSQVRDLLP